MKPSGLIKTLPLDPALCAETVKSARWLAKVRVDQNGCHIWQGCTDQWGYGSVGMGGRTFRAHRVSFVGHAGTDIPRGLVIDHLCRQPSCVNPAHLEAVSVRTNVLRGVAPAASQAKQTSCIKGHPIDGPDAPRQNGKRFCPICKVKSDAARNALLSHAQRLLGISRVEFRKVYGQRKAVALQIIAAHEETK